MAYKNVKPICTGVAPERVQEYQKKYEDPKPLVLYKIALGLILAAAIVVFICGKLL